MSAINDYIATTFPNGPIEGDEFLWGGVRYTFDSTPGVWVGAIPDPGTVQDAATGEEPTNPVEGELWYDPTAQRLNVRTNDEWVDANPQPTAEQLSMTPFLTTQSQGNDITGLTQNTQVMNFTGDITVTGSEGTAVVDVTFPTIPEVPEALPPSTAEPMAYAVSVPATGDTSEPSWTPVTNVVTLRDLNDTVIPDSIPTGYVLAWNGTAWAPAEDMNTDTITTVSATGSSVTVNGTTTDLFTPDSLSLTGSQLTLGRNGTTSLMADLSSLGSSGTPPDPVITVQEDGVAQSTNINVLNFMNVDVSTSGQIATIDIPTPPDVEISVRDSGTTRSSTVNALDFGEGLGVSLSPNGRVATINNTSSGTGGGITGITIESNGTVLSSNIDTINIRDNTTDLISPDISGTTLDLNINELPTWYSTVQFDGTQVSDEVDTFNFMGNFTVSDAGSNTVTIEAPFLAASKDNVSRSTDVRTFNFTGDGVTVTNRGGGTVEVNIPQAMSTGGGGGGSDSPCNPCDPTLEQSGYTSSANQFTKDQIHLSGGTNGSVYRLMVKNNHVSTFYNIRYNFGLASSTVPNDNIRSAIIYRTNLGGAGLWDSVNEEFDIFTPTHNGGAAWRVDSNLRLHPRDVTLMELDISPGGRVSFYTDSSQYVFWNRVILRKPGG